MEGRRDDAVEAYRQAAAQGDSVSLYNMGLLLRNSAPDQAAETFRDAADAGVAAAYDQLGGIYLAQDRLEEAEAAFGVVEHLVRPAKAGHYDI